jgi:hypothetical protein
MKNKPIQGAYGRFAIINSKGVTMEKLEGWAKDISQLLRAEYGQGYSVQILEILDKE